MNAKEKEQQAAVRELREILKPGNTVYVNLEHVSRSGMSRIIMPFVIRDNEPQHLGWAVAKVLGMTYDRDLEGVRISGCGMDMGFALIYSLSSRLFPNGFECIGERCPSNDHSNGDRDYSPHWHESGGYALRHKWV